MNTVDSLKQLSIKFLQKEEHFNFQHQKEFFKPFETIFVSLPNNNIAIKDFILNCIKAIAQNYHMKIKSGWRYSFFIRNSLLFIFYFLFFMALLFIVYCFLFLVYCFLFIVYCLLLYGLIV